MTEFIIHEIDSNIDILKETKTPCHSKRLVIQSIEKGKKKKVDSKSDEGEENMSDEKEEKAKEVEIEVCSETTSSSSHIPKSLKMEPLDLP